MPPRRPGANPPPRPKCKVVDHRVEPRNRRMQANFDIDRGGELIREQPLFNLQVGLKEIFNDDTFYASGPNTGIPAIEREVEALSESVQEKLEDLHNAQPDGPDGVPHGVGIIMTNAFSEEEDRDHYTYHRTIVYDKISQINHSCEPNAELHWNKDTNTGVVEALRRIDAKEEIFLDYLGCRDSLAPAARRKAELQRQYGFTCPCRACNLPRAQQKTNNDLRKKARKCFDILCPAGDEDGPTVATSKHARDYIECLDELGIRDGRLAAGYGYLSDLEQNAAENAVTEIAQTGSHCEACDGGKGAQWHFEQAQIAFIEAWKLDSLTHEETHPIMEKNKKTMLKLFSAPNRLGL